MELFDKEVPKTAEKFRALCTGERGIHLRGSFFSRVIPDFICCAGEGIGREPNFPVEHSSRTFTAVGLLCTAHGVPEGNEPYACDSGFFITTGPAPFLQNMHTIFAQVVGGMDVVKAIEEVGTRSGTPKKAVKISDCGEVPAPAPSPSPAPRPRPGLHRRDLRCYQLSCVVAVCSCSFLDRSRSSGKADCKLRWILLRLRLRLLSYVSRFCEEEISPLINS
ncbi:unnamed protein product [Urochloa humidicola]